MNSLFQRKFHLLALGCLLFLSVAFSVSGLMNEIDLGGEIDLSDEPGIYVTLMSRYSGYECQQVKQWYESCPDTDDLAVTLFLSRTTGKSPAYILALREQDLGWWEISLGLNVNPNDWFIPFKSGLRQPYDKPYGKWAAAGQNGGSLELSDAECRDMVALRFLHRTFEVSVDRAMEMRATGGSLQKISAGEVRRRQATGKTGTKNIASGSAS